MEISIPTLLRIKPNAINKIGKYLRKECFINIALFYGETIKHLIGTQLTRSFESSEISVIYEEDVSTNDLDIIKKRAYSLPNNIDAVVAIGGGKAIDYSKYLAFLLKLPIIAIPTSVSNDGFSSPGASLYVNGRRKSFKAKTPYGVIIDTDIIRNSPSCFTYSGIGDLISKYTAIYDWKLAGRMLKEPVSDFAIQITNNAVENLTKYHNKNIHDLEFLRLICDCLVMSGIAMEVSGSSRPASGSEHLISHAYDMISDNPSLHGIQVGVASYVIGAIQNNPEAQTIKKVLLETGFVNYVSQKPLIRKDFIEAIKLAPSVKPDFYTILSEKQNIDRSLDFINHDDYCRLLIT